MSDLRAEERQARRTQRAEHVSGSLLRYLVILAVGFVVFTALNMDLVPIVAWSGWGVGAVVCALLIGGLLIWVSEHRRTA